MKNNWLVPAVFLLLIAAITYLPLVTGLGFYGDDWHVIWGGNLLGPEEIVRQHLDDRPLEGFEWAGAYMVLGDAPLGWQLFSFLLRVGGGWALYFLLCKIWPERKWIVLSATLLFMVYPGFLRQPQGGIFHPHLLGVLLGLISIGINITILQNQTRFLNQAFLSFLSMAAGVSSYLLMEWMVGLEGIRLTLMGFFMIRNNFIPHHEKLKRGLVVWLPNFVGFAGFIIWRLFLFKSARPVTDIGDLSRKYLTSPLEMVSRLVLETGKDVFETAFLGWVVPFYQLTNRSASETMVTAMLLAGMGCGLVYGFSRWSRLSGNYSSEIDDNNPGSIHDQAIAWDMMRLGLIIAVVAVLPVVFSNRDVIFQDTYDRYSILAAIGSALILAGMGEYLPTVRLRTAGLMTLLGLAIITHYHNATYYQEYWQHQKDMWWQLAWRAPSIKKHTTLVADLPPGYPLAEGYEIWGPANLIYQTERGPMYLSGETLNDDTVIAMLNRVDYGKVVRRVKYTVDFKNALVINYPGNGSCLHVFDGSKVEHSAREDPKIRLVAEISRIELIETSGRQAIPPESIFGKEPDHGWCYFYQKASLARQTGDWQKIGQLASEIKQLGLSPVETSEWMPFYEAYVRMWQLEEANFLGGVLRANAVFQGSYCRQASNNPTPVEQRPTHDKFTFKNLCE